MLSSRTLFKPDSWQPHIFSPVFRQCVARTKSPYLFFSAYLMQADPHLQSSGSDGICAERSIRRPGFPSHCALTSHQLWVFLISPLLESTSSPTCLCFRSAAGVLFVPLRSSYLGLYSQFFCLQATAPVGGGQCWQLKALISFKFTLICGELEK